VHCAVLATFCRAHVDSDAKNSSGMTLACNLWARVALNIALYCACETIVELATKAVTVRLRMHVADGDEADAHH